MVGQANDTYDVCVIGAGILGCMAARALACYRLDVCVLEAAHDVGEGATKANSGLIHAGFHPRGASLKGVSCVRGNALYQSIVEELRVPFIRTGGLYVAFHKEGVDHIEEKRQRAFENGAGWLEVVSGDEARAIEPRLSPRVIAALVAPTTAIVSPFELALATARNAAANGVRFTFGFDVVAVDCASGAWVLRAQDGRVVRARYVLNMAGEQAALIDAQVHDEDLVIRPRRGQYVVFDKQPGWDGFVSSLPDKPTDAQAPYASSAQCAREAAIADFSQACESKPAASTRPPVCHVLYQAQEKDEGGTLLTPTVEGNLLLGPTSENVRSFGDNATTRKGIDHVKRVGEKLVPDLDFGQVITEFAGIRANVVNVAKEQKDFVVRTAAPGFISALGIKNPGMTSAPYLVDVALDLLREEGLALRENPAFDARDQGLHRAPFLRSSRAQQRELLEEDPRFGHVLCRCEGVTEGDVRACMRELLAPTSLDGVKKRLRCGMGRCQGSFCTPRIVEVMADEMGCAPRDVVKGQRGGHVVRKAVK